MIKIIRYTALFFTLTSTSLVLASELESAIVYGNLLTKAVQEKSSVNLKQLDGYQAIEKYLSENKCPSFKYTAYVVGPENIQYLYLIASKGKSIIIGRHFKAVVSEGKVDLESFQSSTKGCLDLGAPPSNVAAMFATHLKPFPNEFHLLQSNLRSIGLYLKTSGGIYNVDDKTMVLSDLE